MRIISQNKQEDVNYDSCHIHCVLNNVSGKYCIDAITAREPVRLGVYTSKEKALAVMGFLRDAYLSFKDFCFLPADDEFGGIAYESIRV